MPTRPGVPGFPQSGTRRPLGILYKTPVTGATMPIRPIASRGTARDPERTEHACDRADEQVRRPGTPDRATAPARRTGPRRSPGTPGRMLYTDPPAGDPATEVAAPVRSRRQGRTRRSGPRRQAVDQCARSGGGLDRTQCRVIHGLVDRRRSGQLDDGVGRAVVTIRGRQVDDLEVVGDALEQGERAWRVRRRASRTGRRTRVAVGGRR